MSDTVTPGSVRDFLYLDAHRLHSLYSQIFKGVPEHIVHSYGGEKATTEATSDVMGRGTRIDVQVAEATLKTENRVLLDYMYSHLEEHLSDHISNVTADTKSDVTLSAGQLIRIVGRAKFLDYGRLIEYTEKFNRFAEVIASAQIATMSGEMEKLRLQAEQVQDRNKRKEAQAQLKALRNPAAMAKQMGLAQDESTLENIRFMVNLMYPGGFDVLISPGENEPHMAFRGILDRQWLRLDPSRLNAAYVGSTEADVVMVGQVCRTRGELGESSATESSATISDHLQVLFRALTEIQSKFDEAGPGKLVVTVLPLAVYTELTLKSHGGAQTAKEVIK